MFWRSSDGYERRLKGRTMYRGCVLLVLLLPTGVVAAQSRDLSGTWVLNLSKSSFGNAPAPSVDSLVITRSGGMYHVDEHTMTAEGPSHMTFEMPVGDGEVTNKVPPQNGQPASAVHETFAQHGDTITSTGEITVAGQKVATQTSREYLTPDKKSYVRDVNLQLAMGGGVPVHFIAVYDRH